MKRLLIFLTIIGTACSSFAQASNQEWLQNLGVNAKAVVAEQEPGVDFTNLLFMGFSNTKVDHTAETAVDTLSITYLQLDSGVEQEQNGVPGTLYETLTVHLSILTGGTNFTSREPLFKPTPTEEAQATVIPDFLNGPVYQTIRYLHPGIMYASLVCWFILSLVLYSIYKLPFLMLLVGSCGLNLAAVLGGKFLGDHLTLQLAILPVASFLGSMLGLLAIIRALKHLQNKKAPTASETT